MATKIIAIDAGHGYNTGGRRCLKKFDPAEHREWWLNDRIADLVESELVRDYDCKVVRTDDTTGAKDISLSNRVKTANTANANIFVSIHHNAGINGGNGGGTVVYSYKNDSDKARAVRLYNYVIAQTNLKGNRSTPTAIGNFYVINKTKMPALLLENGFMDSKIDVPIIISQAHAEKTTKGIVNFLVAELKLEKKKVVATAKPTTTPTVQSSLYYPKCDKKYTTIYSALTSIGVNGGYSFRRKIARANNIGGLNGIAYVGSAQQNTQMLNLLKAGLLIKPQ